MRNEYNNKLFYNSLKLMKRYFVLLTLWVLFISVGNAQVIPNGIYEIRYASAPSYAISLYEGTVVSGNNVVLYSCTGENTQKWIVTNSADGSISLNNFANTHYAIDLDHGKAANGTNLLLWGSDNRINQRWIPERKGESFILRSAVNTNYVIDLDNNTAENNRNIQLWESNNSNSQLWQFVRINAQEKEVYIPKEILEQDFENPESNWCRQRMRLTPNFTILWEKGFGNDPSHAPDLDGKNMCVDLDALAEHAEEIYDMYRNKMKFVGDYSKCDVYRMLIYLKYNNDNTAWGGSRDNTIGAVTQICPGHIRRSWNMLAHEIGHCFQQQIGCDRIPHDYFGHKHGLCELCSQWGLWNYNNNWVSDELIHLNNYILLTHKPFLHRALCGRAPYILEYWSEKYGITFIGELYREGHNGEDVVTVFRRMMNMGQQQFCDEVFDAFRHTVNLDFKLNWEGNRELGLKFGVDYDKSNEYWQVPVEICPESYGYNAINLDFPSPGQTVTVHFEGLIPHSPYISNHSDNAGWRYGFVMVDDKGKSHYGEKSSSIMGTVSFTAPQGITIKKLWLVVMGAPTVHWDMPDDEQNQGLIDAQWPYRIRVTYDEGNPQNWKEVYVKSAGELKQLVEEDEQIRKAVALRVKGQLNGTDFLILRNLTGRDYDGTATNGGLRYVDFTESQIVDGGERYGYDVELDDSGTKENVFPAHSFQNTNIRKVILPATVTSIGRYAFGSCQSLEEVVYGDNISSLDFAAFTYSSLRDFHIKDNVTYMETYVFNQMKNLQRVHVGDGLTRIPRRTFNGCLNLEEVVLGANLQILDAEAFAGCEKLSCIVCLCSRPMNITEDVFPEKSYDNAVLYVPMGTSNLYQQLSGWKRFKNIVEIGVSDISEIKLSKRTPAKAIYDLNGKRIGSDQMKPMGKYVWHGKIVIAK